MGALGAIPTPIEIHTKGYAYADILFLDILIVKSIIIKDKNSLL